MSKEEKFKIDIENIKNELAIEDMYLTEKDIQLYRRYVDNEITMTQLIDTIKQDTIGGIS